MIHSKKKCGHFEINLFFLMNSFDFIWLIHELSVKKNSKCSFSERSDPCRMIDC